MYCFQYDPKEDDVGKLKQLFKVTKAVMKSRHEQVEEIMDEMEKETKSTKKKGQRSGFSLVVLHSNLTTVSYRSWFKVLSA